MTTFIKPTSKKKFMNSPALVINSHSSNGDCLEIFFSQLEKHVDIGFFSNIYLLVDTCESIPSYVTCIKYDPESCFTDQMISCLSSIEEEIILYANEDYVLYGRPDLGFLSKLASFLKDCNDLSYLRFVYADIEKWITFTEIEDKELLYIPPSSQFCFSQTLSLWKTKDYLNIHIEGPKSSIGIKGESEGHFEVLAKPICKDLNIQGAVVFNSINKKRGIFHYDSESFPHIASALVKGRWNVSEYPELEKILAENCIDTTIRGVV